MACHFNSLHFLGEAPESLSKMLSSVLRAITSRCSSSKRAHLCRKSAMIEEKIEEVRWVRLAVPPSHPRQALTRLEMHPTKTSIAVFPH